MFYTWYICDKYSILMFPSIEQKYYYMYFVLMNAIRHEHQVVQDTSTVFGKYV